MSATAEVKHKSFIAHTETVVQDVDNCADLWKLSKSVLALGAGCFKELAKLPGYMNALAAAGNIYDSFSILAIGRDIFAIYKTIINFSLDKSIELVKNVSDLVCDTSVARALIATFAIWNITALGVANCALLGFGTLAVSFAIRAYQLLPEIMKGDSKIPWVALTKDIALVATGILGCLTVYTAYTFTIPLVFLGITSAAAGITHAYLTSMDKDGCFEKAV